MGALRVLPEDVPSFFRHGAAVVGHCAVDPDVRKSPQTPSLTSREGPEHYIDIERFEDIRKRPLRNDILAYAIEKEIPVDHLGFVPWATVEWTEQLTLAFAEHRRWPDNPAIRAKVLVYAGNLSHYAADLGQPLHTTIHHDGRALPDGSSPYVGMHRQVDGWISKIAMNPPGDLSKDIQPRVLDDLFGGVMDWLDETHSLVDRVYELHDKDCAVEIDKFSRQRFRDNVEFLANLYLSAWRKSAEIRLPAWLERPVLGAADSAVER